MHSTTIAVRWFFVGCLAICASLGCGAGDYRAKMTSQLSKLKRGAPFAKLTSSTQLLDTRLAVQIPEVFKTFLQPGQLDPSNNVVPAFRIRPPFVTLPGFKLTYEYINQVLSGDLEPLYLYLCISPGNEAAAQKQRDLLLKAIKAAFPKADAAWVDVQLATPSEGTIEWKRLTVEGEQLFYTQQATAAPKKIEGKFDLWMHHEQGQIVMLGWRYTPGSVQNLNLEELVTATCGAVRVLEPPPKDDKADAKAKEAPPKADEGQAAEAAPEEAVPQEAVPEAAAPEEAAAP